MHHGYEVRASQVRLELTLDVRVRVSPVLLEFLQHEAHALERVKHTLQHYL